MSTSAQEDARTAAVAEMLLGFVEASPELREAAFFDAGGTQLYATDGEDWSDRARRLWAAADGAEGPARYVHVATGTGEVLAARTEAGFAIALADRFPLASLVLSDLRAVLRELEPGAVAGRRG
jgi:hypothetical protein